MPDRDAFLYALPVDLPGLAPDPNAQYRRVICTTVGAFWSSLVTDQENPVAENAYTADGQAPSAAPGGTMGFNVAANLRALNAAGNIDRARFLASDTDAQLAAQLGLTGAVMRPYIYNGATFDRQRAPVFFASGAVTAAGSTLFIGGLAGQRIRVLGYSFSVTSNVAAAAAGIEVVSFLDAAVATGLATRFFVPAVSVVTGFGAHTTGWVNIGPLGFLGGAANALNVNLSLALTAGEVAVSVAYIQAAGA